MKKEIFLSIIIPAYYEEKRIEKAINTIEQYLSGAGLNAEIIVVVDEKDEKTTSILNLLKVKFDNIQIMVNPYQKGKGSNIKYGVQNSNGRLIFFTDTDLSTPITEIDKFIEALNNKCDIAIASRFTRNAEITVAQPMIRKFSGRIFRIMRKLLGLVTFIEDTQCGFKGFKKETALDIFSDQNIAGFTFDVEILHIARKRGYKIEEIPVRWEDDKNTKVKLYSAGINMFLDLFKIKLKDILGHYK